MTAQYTDRVRQALATDARVEGTTIRGLSFTHVINVANEIAGLYPTITPADIADTLNHIREEAT